MPLSKAMSANELPITARPDDYSLNLPAKSLAAKAFNPNFNNICVKLSRGILPLCAILKHMLYGKEK
jgi:hypothetical protein